LRNHTSTLPAGSTTVGVECHAAYINPGFPYNQNFMNYAPGTTCSCVTITHTSADNSLAVILGFPLPSVTFPASALVPMARRSGMPAVVRAYDAGMSVPAVRS